MQGPNIPHPYADSLTPADNTTLSTPPPPFDRRSLEVFTSNNWPQPSDQVILGPQRAASDLAFAAGSQSFAERLHRCNLDSAVLRRPDGSLTFARLGCNHRLCPLCAKHKSAVMLRRLQPIAHLAPIAVTLTCRTLTDTALRENTLALKQAFRLMSHARSRSWAPFARGYYWKLEITSGAGFHPHYHVLSVEPHISIESLTARWKTALRSAGLKGGYCWITKVDKQSLREFAKYLTKSITAIDSTRWPDLLYGLQNQRVYGSGGALRIPPKPQSTTQFLGRATQLFFASDTSKEITQFIAANRLLPLIFPEDPSNA